MSSGYVLEFLGQLCLAKLLPRRFIDIRRSSVSGEVLSKAFAKLRAHSGNKSLITSLVSFCQLIEYHSACFSDQPLETSALVAKKKARSIAAHCSQVPQA
jgi:hypothetical protein